MRLEGRDYDKAKEALERSGVLTGFRDKVTILRKDWDQLAAAAELLSVNPSPQPFQGELSDLAARSPHFLDAHGSFRARRVTDKTTSPPPRYAQRRVQHRHHAQCQDLNAALIAFAPGNAIGAIARTPPPS